MIYHGLDAWSTVYLSVAVVSHLWINRRVELHKISVLYRTDMRKLPSPKMWRRVVWHKFTAVSEERPASVFSSKCHPVAKWFNDTSNDLTDTNYALYIHLWNCSRLHAWIMERKEYVHLESTEMHSGMWSHAFLFINTNFQNSLIRMHTLNQMQSESKGQNNASAPHSLDLTHVTHNFQQGKEVSLFPERFWLPLRTTQPSFWWVHRPPPWE